MSGTQARRPSFILLVKADGSAVPSRLLRRQRIPIGPSFELIPGQRRSPLQATARRPAQHAMMRRTARADQGAQVEIAPPYSSRQCSTVGRPVTHRLVQKCAPRQRKISSHQERARRPQECAQLVEECGIWCLLRLVVLEVFWEHPIRRIGSPGALLPCLLRWWPSRAIHKEAL